MVKVTGIDIGSSFIHLVELQGTGRGYELESARSLPRSVVPQSEESPDILLDGDLKNAFAGMDIEKGHSLLAVGGAACVLRNIKVPFKGKDEIRKILKFEAESSIHSHSIDDIVVDASLVKESEDGTELFVAACPKEHLGRQLKALQTAGVDTEFCDLDMSLLLEGARHLGVVLEPPGREEGEDGESVVLLLDLGSSSVNLILVVGGRLHTGRSLRWGVDHLERRIAERMDLPAPVVRRSLHARFGLGEAPLQSPVAVLAEEGEREEGEQEAPDGKDAPPEPREENLPEIPGYLLEAEVRSFGTRILSEAVRFQIGAKLDKGPEAILLSGGGALLPGLADSLSLEAGTPVHHLDLLGHGGFGEGEGPTSGLDLAFAAALAGIGAIPRTMNFRQEELSYKRKFDKLKFPLALFCLLLAITLLFHDLVLLKGLRAISRGLGEEVYVTSRGKKVKTWSGLMNHLTRQGGEVTRLLDQYETTNPKYRKRSFLKLLRNTEPRDRIHETRIFLRNLRRERGKDIGYIPEMKLESGLSIFQTFNEAVDKADRDPALKRFVIPSIKLQVGTSKNRSLQFVVAFEREDFRGQNAIFKSIFQSYCGKGKAFESVTDSSETQLPEGLYGASYSYMIKLNKSIGNLQPRR